MHIGPAHLDEFAIICAIMCQELRDDRERLAGIYVIARTGAEEIAGTITVGVEVATGLVALPSIAGWQTAPLVLLFVEVLIGAQIGFLKTINPVATTSSTVVRVGRAVGSRLPTLLVLPWRCPGAAAGALFGDPVAAASLAIASRSCAVLRGLSTRIVGCPRAAARAIR